VISVAEHLARILSVVSPLSPLQLGLMDAHGCILTEDVVADAALPGFDNSSQDGYAVRRDDLLGDDLIDARDPLLETMVAVQAEHGGSVVALMEVPRESISMYGCAAVEGSRDGAGGDTVRITGLVEKPPADQAPSNLAIIGRYVLSPTVFAVLRTIPRGRGGEYQLTDAIQELIALEPVHGVIFRGRRYDTGDRLDYLKAIVQLAADRDDLGPPLLAWLSEWIETRR